MTYPEHILRAADIQREAQAGGTDLPALIDKHRASRNPEVRSLARAAEAVVNAVKDLHWTSRRYCDGRRSYAVGMHNDHTRTLLALGIPLNPTGDGTLWAADGNGLRGPTPADMGEEWSSYQNTVTALSGMLDVLRHERDAARAELAGFRDAQVAPAGDVPRTGNRYLTGSAGELGYLRGWHTVRAADPKTVQTLRAQLARDTEQLNAHGPAAPDLQARIDAVGARLAAICPLEEPPC